MRTAQADMNPSRGKPGTAAAAPAGTAAAAPGTAAAAPTGTAAAAPGTAAAAPTGTQAVDRAAQLLIQVVHGPGPVTFTELTAAAGLAKSTTSRLLMALERHGLLQRDGRGRFLPGEVFVSYAWRGGAEAGLVSVAQPFLDRLGGATGETIHPGAASRGRGGQVAQAD